MKITIKALLLMLVLGRSVWAVEVVATVNGEDITTQDAEIFLANSKPGAHFKFLTKKEKKSVVEQLIDRKLYMEYAKREHIENSSAFKKAFARMREKLMVDYWMKEKVEKIVISDREAKEHYQKNLTNFYRPASVKVRHILLASNAEAVEIITLLKGKKGSELKEKFIALAKEKSTGPSAVNGGELDWFVQEQMLPEFSDVAFHLKKGKITKEPVHTQFGYHVIYLEDKKESGIVPFQEVKNKIVKALRVIQFKAKLVELSKKMKKTAKITVK
jgi:parvulin-like peptidyl-prolyl isomerase